MKNTAFLMLVVVTLAFGSVAAPAQMSPSAVSGSNPRPQAVSGSNPRPQVAATPGSLVVAIHVVMSYFGM